MVSQDKQLRRNYRRRESSKNFTKDILAFQKELYSFMLRDWFKTTAPEMNMKIILKHTSFHAERRKACKNGWHPKCGKPMRDFL